MTLMCSGAANRKILKDIVDIINHSYHQAA
jgi:hypothetical protein